ncbi:MAG: hypothetical protein J2P41_11190 [Blastocatellia bacterium]|nr:hypothetical protein [Blastocatellia bacterium]
MSQSLEKLSRNKSALGMVQFGSAVTSVGIFYLFYVVLDNPLWIAGPVALAAFGALWQLLVAPVQKRVIEGQAGAQALAAIERKISALRELAGRIPDGVLSGQVREMAENFNYAFQVQRSRTEPMTEMLAHTLTGMALDSTYTLLSSYLNLLSKRQPNKGEQESINAARTFILNLATEIHNQAVKLKSMAEDSTDEQVGIDANMAALQMLFNNVDLTKEGGES